jgi:hypothetical protein
MKLTEDQRNAFNDSLPTSIDDDDFLVFEDDGGGWHHDPSISTWVSWSVISDGISYLYNVRSCLSETWNSDLSCIDDERGKIERGNIAIYCCSTDKNKSQNHSSYIAEQIDRTRLGLSLDYEGITTGPNESTSRPLPSYVDNRLKKRVYRNLIETPILYKSVVIERPPLIKKIELHPWMGYPNAEMDHYFVTAPLLLKADMLLADVHSFSLEASIVLEESE